LLHPATEISDLRPFQMTERRAWVSDQLSPIHAEF
jgi:hypothetical protein